MHEVFDELDCVADLDPAVVRCTDYMGMVISKLARWTPRTNSSCGDYSLYCVCGRGCWWHPVLDVLCLRAFFNTMAIAANLHSGRIRIGFVDCQFDCGALSAIEKLFEVVDPCRIDNVRLAVYVLVSARKYPLNRKSTKDRARRERSKREVGCEP